MTWTCHVCGDRRADSLIHVFKSDRSGDRHLPPGTWVENVRYCTDRERCRVRAPYVRLGHVDEPSDPRVLGGDIAGPGGPHEVDGVVVDTRRAVLLDRQEVSLVEARAGEQAVALLLEGRINRTRERARVLFLTNADGIAALLTEVVALASRAEPLLPELRERVSERFAELRSVGGL